MNLKIWHKMIIGISIPSLVVIIGGLLTLYYLNNVKTRHGFVEIADDLRERVLEIRRNEKNFLLHKTTEYYKYFKSSISILQRSASNIPEAIIDQVGKSEFLLLRNSIQNYQDLLNNLLENYLHEERQVEKVREEGRHLESFVAKKNHAVELSTDFVLNLRRFEKNYMLFRDKASFDELNKGLAQFDNIIPFCIECIRYANAINELLNVHTDQTRLEGSLQIIGNKLEEITNTISIRERENVRSFFSVTQHRLLIVLVLLCVMGPLFVYKTATHIVKPIKRLAEITKRISEGDLSLRAPLKEHDETFQLSQSFNTMLDKLQFTQQSLERSLELLHEKHVEAEKRASLGFLVSGVAHELNNPLNNISLTAETMKEDLDTMTREEQKEYIQDILTQSERAKHIIEELLDFVGTRKSTAMEKLDIINVLGESIHLVSNQLKVTNIKLKLDVPQYPFFIKGNQSKIEEIFVNIMVNAIHAMKDSGTLTICARPGSGQRNIFIDISDTGCGIEEKEIRNIFEPFYTTKPVGEGTGLGLSVAYSLVSKHNGDISVKSKVGKGTTFSIRFPAYDESSVPEISNT
ncbi:MAG: sensor histidine kinase [Nitrospiraceae bacterium]|nr:MAG: sensor histidine kinase [Nitrospiraceae bacterium]